MSYIDGFVVPVPKAKIEEYEAMSRRTGPVWKEFGALAFCEYRGDDVKSGKLTSFPQAVDLKDDEVVYFAWIVYPSREARDAIVAKVMADPRLAEMMDPAKLPFDGKRMIFGGFEAAIEL